eukprot:TRINITY_DN15513_c0_g1_i1.p1 TRINITY_DN15513_c0_g1~~TRINITY_DN15513_c0_g1_i1.p1  ORF type:complete len:401 (+),score=96.78 TRINITY_DN15513_c0_g1_i1:28-1230(+)
MHRGGGYPDPAAGADPVADAGPALPVFDVDLDAAPEVRWQAVAAAYAPKLQAIAEWQLSLTAGCGTARANRRGGANSGKRSKAKGGRSSKQQEGERMLAKYAAEEAPRMLEALRDAGGATAELASELAGVAAAAGVGLEVLAMLSLQYEAYCACTSIIIPTEDGSVALARTLDWELPQLKLLNIDVRVHRRGKLLYTATTWAGYIGILTAQRPGRYGAAVNFRERAPGDAAAIKAAAASATGDVATALRLPVGLAVRLAFERCAGYSDFVEEIATVPCMAPFYCLVASARGEGAQITRADLAELPRRQLGADVTHLVQANMDRWDTDPANDTQESLERCRVAGELLRLALERGYASEAELWEVLWSYPIYEEDAPRRKAPSAKPKKTRVNGGAASKRVKK